MSLDSTRTHRRQMGFSLIELLVGMTIGFIAMVVIVQTLSVFEGHKRTTTAAADAQENGLIAMMAIEEDIREAGSGFNHPATFSCEKLFYHYQEVSGTGVPVSTAPFLPVPVLIEDQVSVKVDRIHIQQGLRFTGSVPTRLSEPMEVAPATAESVELRVDRAFDFNGDPVAPATAPLADVILVVHPDSAYCSLMRVSSKTGKVLTITHGPAGKTKEYNPTHAYMTANNWPGFGTLVAYPETSFVFRVGDKVAGGVKSTSYSVSANNSLQADISVSGAASSPETLASEIVALQAQYGVSTSKDVKSISEWVNATGTTWGMSALKENTTAAVNNRQRIKAIRVAVVARSAKRDAGLVTSACTDNHATNYGPCSWTDDTAANPAPAIDLRAGGGDTEWQHYRYKVYQTVIPMRNVLWPNL